MSRAGATPKNDRPNFGKFSYTSARSDPNYRGGGGLKGSTLEALEWDGRGLSNASQTRTISVTYAGEHGTTNHAKFEHSPPDDPVGWALFKGGKPAENKASTIDALAALDLDHKVNYHPDGKRYDVTLSGVDGMVSRPNYVSTGVDTAGYKVDAKGLDRIWRLTVSQIEKPAIGAKIIDIPYQIQVGNLCDDVGDNVREPASGILENLPPSGVYNDFDFGYRCRVPQQGWKERESDRGKGNQECDLIGDLSTNEKEKISISLAYDSHGYRIFLNNVPESTPLELLKEYDFNL